MIDQMYLGPRGSWLEIDPDQRRHLAGRRSDVVSGAVHVKYHVAKADWGLVLNNVANPAAGVQTASTCVSPSPTTTA